MNSVNVVKIFQGEEKKNAKTEIYHQILESSKWINKGVTKKTVKVYEASFSNPLCIFAKEQFMEDMSNYTAKDIYEAIMGNNSSVILFVEFE